jgi:hypothetical protein
MTLTCQINQMHKKQEGAFFTIGGQKSKTYELSAIKKDDSL